MVKCPEYYADINAHNEFPKKSKHKLIIDSTNDFDRNIIRRKVVGFFLNELLKLTKFVSNDLIKFVRK